MSSSCCHFLRTTACESTKQGRNEQVSCYIWHYIFIKSILLIINNLCPRTTQVNSRQIFTHLAWSDTDSLCASYSELAVRVQSPTGHIAIVENSACEIVTCSNCSRILISSGRGNNLV